MSANRTRIAAGLCLALTLGTVVNVFALQDARRSPLAAEAAILPDASVLLSADGKAVMTGPGGQRSDAVGDPAARTMSNADADLSVRTVNGTEALANPPTVSADPINAKLVAGIQRELAARGYDSGRVNGILGILTRAAILAFEFDNGFALTAEPSEELLRQIVLGLTGAQGVTPQPETERASRLIAGAQRLLQRLGYDPGPISGHLTDSSRKALRRFEGDVGLVPKGRVSGEVLSELARRAHARIEVSDEALSN